MSQPAIQYWIIWGPAGQTNPKVRFPSRSQAVKVAKHMALIHDAEFVVMKAIESIVPAPKTISTFFEPEPLPIKQNEHYNDLDYKSWV